MKPERWQLIEEIYHTALENAPDQRSAFIAEACADDDALRREVEELIAAYLNAGRFLATPAFELEARNLASENSTPRYGFKTGHELSHYTILSRIGAGGMGEVFLARDSVLERRVALKLLPVECTQNAERLQRFTREAKAASALNHPNIITIYEIGAVATTHGLTHFIATEFIEGETLRTWTPNPETRLKQTLDAAVQISSALDAAHRTGIVHRDIKPENLMVRPDGLVKVLDFGLAKLTTQTPDTSDPSVPTPLEALKTQPGVILGTLRYMSPEQARGRTLDARSDIFSFGAVLYEMLTAQPLFSGETDADVVAGIIHKEAPPLAEYLSDAPPELERIVQKALAKDVERRYQSACDLQVDLQTLMRNSELSGRLALSGAAAASLTTQTSGVPPAPRFSIRQLLLGMALALLVAAAIWWLVAWPSGQVEMPPLDSLKTTEVVTWQSAPGEVYSLGAFSPDGKWVAFTSTQGGSKNIWIKQSSTGDAEPSTRDDFVNDNPIWSPDGDEIAFTSTRGNQRGIWRKPPLGGTPSLLKTLESGEGSVRLRYWSRKSGTIYYESRQNLFALDVNSGQTSPVANLDPTKVRANTVSVSPDEQQIVYVSTGDDGSALWLAPMKGVPPKQIAGPFLDARNPVWHPDSERVFFSLRVNGIYQIFVTDTAGHKPVQITFGERESFVLDASADGSKILYGSSKEESDIWGVNIGKADEFTLASDISFELWPDVSPDNQTLAYQAVENLSQGDILFNCSILTKPIGTDVKPFALVRDGFLPKWSPDGKVLAYLRLLNTDVGLWTVNASGGEEKQLTTGGLPLVDFSVLPYQRWQASNFGWSPDGSKIVYVSSRSGQRNLWTVAIEGTNDTQITNNTDANLLLYCPLWSANSKRIAYSSRLNKVAAGEKNTYSVWVTDVESKNSKPVFQSNFLRLIGWSQSDEDLILATSSRTVTGQPADVNLIRLSTRTGEQSSIAVLRSAYFYNVYLSSDRRLIAFTANRDGKDRDDIWVIPVMGGEARRVTANRDPRLYFSSLAWSPDSRAIYFGKQVRYSRLSMITNFK